MTALVHAISYRRSGGRAPGEDERLEIGIDGAFELWRTVAIGRVGAFAGNLDEGALDELSRLASAAVDAGSDAAASGEPVRGRALEELTVGATAVVVTAGPLSEPWEVLIRAVRRLVHERTDKPVAALEALLATDASTLTLEVVGSDGLGLDLGRGTVDLHALADGVATASAQTDLAPFAPGGGGADDGPSAAPTSLDDAIAASTPDCPPGWSLEVPLNRPDVDERAGGGQGPAWQADVTGRMSWRDRTVTFSVRATAPAPSEE